MRICWGGDLVGQRRARESRPVRETIRHPRGVRWHRGHEMATLAARVPGDCRARTEGRCKSPLHSVICSASSKLVAQRNIRQRPTATRLPLPRTGVASDAEEPSWTGQAWCRRRRIGRRYIGYAYCEPAIRRGYPRAVMGGMGTLGAGGTNSEFPRAICAMRVSPSPGNGDGDIDAFKMP
jgi:hypothetical protein